MSRNLLHCLLIGADLADMDQTGGGSVCEEIIVRTENINKNALL
jgi:hypothetical protein